MNVLVRGAYTLEMHAFEHFEKVSSIQIKARNDKTRQNK